jgi:quinol monooxygenase YgiN
MSDLIQNVRTNLAKLGTSEATLRHNNECLQELWEQKQQLMAEMNTAKKAAAEEAAKPYLQAIAELDQTYATILALMG